MAIEIISMVKSLFEVGTQNKGPLEVFAAVVTILTGLIGLITGLVTVMKWLAIRRSKPNERELQLSDPPYAENSLSRFTTQVVPVLGRQQEEARLRDFLQSGDRFAWLQIAGVGGQGKSRLAFDLMLLARERNWKAGWLEAPAMKAFTERWDSWQPRQPHLLILDYVVGRESSIKLVMQTLSQRKDELKRPVRLLLLERQRWDRGGIRMPERSIGNGIALSFEGRAEWFLKLTERPDGNDPIIENSRFEDGVIELERLSEDDLVKIVHEVAAWVKVEITMSDEFIKKQLVHIDSAGRPLYAYFLGQVLAARLEPSRGESGRILQRDELLNEILDRDCGSRWQKILGEGAPRLGGNSPAERIAILATMVGGLHCVEAARSGLIPQADDATLCKALVLTDGPLGDSATGPSEFIPALQPDLLGEWFVLRAIAKRLRRKELLTLAWRYGPKPTAAFLQRLSQDFPEHEVTKELLEMEPPNDQARTAFAAVASSILSNLYYAQCPISDSVVSALTTAAHGGDDSAMHSLGVCLAEGIGTKQDTAVAITWIQKAVEKAHVGAMVNLGVCLAEGIGIKQDTAVAITWIQKAAEKGHIGAMDNLGRCLAQGIGTKQDPVAAIEWFQQAAAEGYAPAMYNLGVYLAQGIGIKQDSVVAFGWFQKAAMKGHREAMYRLGMCHSQGFGVIQDSKAAIPWFKKAAEKGHVGAIYNLGVCYAQGIGVPQDLAAAIDWYQKAAAKDHADAMYNLGGCHEKGIGVPQDLAAAIDWYQKAAAAGDETAKRRLPVIRSLELLVKSGSSSDQVSDLWAYQPADRLNRVPWAAPPPIRAHWEDLTGSAAPEVFARLRQAFAAMGFSDKLESLNVQRMRSTSLAFYKNCSLVDVQLGRRGGDSVQFVSALVTQTGAALLDGKSDILHAVNPYLLELMNNEAACAYLRFFCMFVHGNDGPFQIVEDISDLSAEVVQFIASNQVACEAISHLRLIETGPESGGWYQFVGCLLHGNALYQATFKVLANGNVGMPNGQPLIDTLPFHGPRFEGIFRIP